MAGSGTLGRLTVDLLVETADWITGLNKAEYEAQKFADAIGAKMEKMAGRAVDAMKGIAAGMIAGFAVERVVGFINETQKAADALDELAQKTGTSINFLAQMSVTAEMSGSSLEGIAKSMDKLNKATTEAFGNESSKPAEVFKALGVEVRNASGELKSSEEIFNEVAKALGGLEDGAIKSAAAQAIFGKSGAELIPVFNALANQSKELTDATKAYGEQMKILAPLAGALEEQQAILNTKSKAFAAILGEELIPYVTSLTATMNDAAGAAGTMSTPFETMLNAFKGIVMVVDTLITGITQLLTVLVVGGESLVKLMAGDWAGASKAAAEALATLDAQGQAWVKRMNAMADPLSTLTDQTNKAKKASEELAAALASGDGERMKRQNAAWVKSIQDGIDAEKKLAEAIIERQKKSEEAARKFAQEQKKVQAEGDKDWVKAIDEQIARDAKMGEALHQNALKRNADQLAALRLSLDAEAKMKKEAQDAADKYQREALAKMVQEQERMWGELYKNIESAGRSAFDAIFDDTKGGWDGLMQSLKNSFKKILLDYLYSQFAKPFIMKVMASAGGGFGAYASNQMGQQTGDWSGGFDWSGMVGKAKDWWSSNYGAASYAEGGSNFVGPMPEGYTAAAGGAGSGVSWTSAGTGMTGMAMTAGAGIVGGAFGGAVANAWGAGERGQANATNYAATGAAIGMQVYGPIGAAVGAIIGTIVGISTDPDPDAMRKANFGGTAGAEGITPWTGESKFGKFGFSAGEWLSDEQMGDTMKQFIAGVQVMDNTLASFMSPEQIANVKKRLEEASKQYELGMEHENVAGLGAIIRDRLQIVADEFNTGLGAFVDGFEGTTEDLTAIVTSFMQLTAMSTDFDPVKIVEEATRQTTGMEAYQTNRSDLTEFTASLDGSAESMTGLVERMIAFQQATVEMIMVIDAAAASMHKMFTDTADSIRLATMTDEQRYQFLQDRSSKLFDEMMAETDPQKIAELAGRINADINAAWGMLSDDQKGALSEAYLERLDRLDSVVADKMEGLRDVVVEDSDTAMEDIRAKLDEVFVKANEAADKNNEAADKNIEAANTPLRVIITDDGIVTQGG